MPEPILAANSSWFAPNVSTIKRANITEIEIMDSYTPNASVTVTDTWDASAAKDGSVTCYVIGTKLIIAGNGSGKVYLNEDSDCAFSDRNFKDYFSSVSTFTGLNIINTEKTSILLRTFYYMESLLYLPGIKNWDTSHITGMNSVFAYCNNLMELDVSSWDTNNVQDCIAVFAWLDNIKKIDISNWDTSNVKHMGQLFQGCTKAEQIILPKTGFPSIIDDKSWNYNTDIFKYCEKLTSIDVSGINFSFIKGLENTFKGCKLLKEIIGINTADFMNVKTFLSMFEGCSSLKNLDTSNWNTSSCTNMSFMFYSCTSLGEIDVSNWDTSKLTNLDHFAAHANLKRKGMGNWNTSSLVNANAAFHNCAEEELDLSKWDVSKVQFFCQMFENSPNLKRIKGLDKWNTSAGLGFDGMFERCSKLEELDLSSFNTTKAKNNVSASSNGHKTATMNNMFLTCNNLEKVTVGANFSVNGDGTNTTTANKAILPTPSATYIPGADGNWYTFSGDQYAPNAMKDRTAATYYASRTAVYDADVIVKNSSLIDTAKAIREKNGTTAQYTPSEFGAAIRAL